MLEILFESPKEAEMIYSIFRSICKERNLEIYLQHSNYVQINPKNWDEYIESVVIPGIIHFIIEHKEQDMMLFIIRHHFYFKEQEEQQQILHIAQSIIEGDRSEIPGVQKFQHREIYLKEALQQFLRPNLSFSFDSYLKFRMRHYLKQLQQYVEAAIEEYKLEQEYQIFIQTLRDYIALATCKINKVIIHHDKEFTVYNQAGIKMTEQELKKYIDNQFIRNEHNMYVDCKLLAPLVSISPETIILYTNEPDDGMNRTIQNIFQERVKIYPALNR